MMRLELFATGTRVVAFLLLSAAGAAAQVLQVSGKVTLKQADGKGMTPLFREMMELHELNAAELARALARDDEVADEKGSFMTVVHETIMDVRSMFKGLEESVLPGLIDGEKRNVSKYDGAILTARTRPIIANFLASQRDRIVKKIAAMETQKAANEHKA